MAVRSLRTRVCSASGSMSASDPGSCWVNCGHPGGSAHSALFRRSTVTAHLLGRIVGVRGEDFLIGRHDL